MVVVRGQSKYDWEDNSDSGSDGTNKDNKNLTKSFDRSVLPTDTVRQLLRAVLASKVSSGDNSNGNNKNIPNLNQQFQFSPVSGSSKPMPKQDDIKKDSEHSMEKKWSLSNIYANTRQISQDLLDIVATEKLWSIENSDWKGNLLCTVW